MSATAPVRVRIVAANVATGGAVLFVVLVATLHGLRPDLEPSWRFIREYSVGLFGWMMQLAFVSVSLAHVALGVALGHWLRSWPGRVTQGLLLVAAAGFLLGALFTTDLATWEGPPTWHGRLHNIGATLGSAMPLAALLGTWRLVRLPAWRSARRALMVTAGLTALGLAGSITAFALLLPPDGRIGPDVPLGWPLRVELTTYLGWFVTTSLFAARFARVPASRGAA